MGNFLYTIAVVLLLIWAIGYFGYKQGGIVHLLFVLAALAVVLRLIPWKKDQ